MSNFMRYVLLLIFTCISLFADLKDPYVLAATEGDPSSNLCPHVNSLTGDFLISEADIVILAAQPLIVHRSYVSGDGNGGWTFFPHTLLKVMDGGSKKKKYIRVAEPTGSMITYKVTEHDPHVYRLSIEKHGKGITNTSQGTISGRTNLRNTVVIRKGPEVIVHCANGTVRTYKKTSPRTYLLKLEQLSNGNYIIYHYNKQERLKRICTSGPSKTEVYAEIKFRYLDKESGFEITTSDGRVLHYDMWGGLIKKATFTEKPEEKFEFTAGLDVHFFVKERQFPEGRKIRVDYYTKKDTGSFKDPRCDRVKTIYEMVGEELVPTYRFSYDISREKIKKKKKRYAYKENGKTDIYDALNNLTRVHFSPNFYINAIERFDKETLYTKLKFEWREYGQLKAKIFYDKENNKVWEKRFEYDARGNVLEEIFSGDLSGEGAFQSYTTTYTYDDHNLMLTQTEENGRCTTYEYKSGTDLLSFRGLHDGKKMIKREFHQYNAKNLLETLITDDGETWELDNLSGVTERFITKFSYEEHGLPEWIEEYYLRDGCEKLITKTFIRYNLQRRVEYKTIYDSENQSRYTLEYNYDRYGFLTCETNPAGQTTYITNDCFGNQFTCTLPGGVVHEKHHDKGNHVTCHVVKAEGKKHHTYYKYNHKYQQTKILDYLNREIVFERDLDGNVIKTIFPKVQNEDGQEIEPIARAEYNCLGKITSETTPLGRTTTTRYNSRGSPIEITYSNGTIETFTYNLDGTLKTAVDQKGYETVYLYNTCQQLIQKTVAGMVVQILTYNSFHITSQTDNEGRHTTYTYDKAGRKDSETTEGETITYSYDALGFLARTTSQDLHLFTKYNLLGQLKEEREENAKKEILARIRYFYDLAGNCEEIIRYFDDTVATEITRYDSWNRVYEKKDPLGHSTLIFYSDTSPFTITEIDPLGNQTITTFDVLDRPLSVERKNTFGVQTAFNEMFYTADGDLALQKTALISPDGHQEILMTHLKYDSMGRTIKVVEAEGASKQKTTTYGYTLRGERASITKPDGVVLTYIFDPLGRLEDLSSSADDCHYRYFYEKTLTKPFLIQDEITGKATERSYDARGRLEKETLATGLTFINRYDLQGRRLQLTLPDSSFIRYSYKTKHLHTVSRYDANGIHAYTHTYTHYDKSGAPRSQQLIGNLGSLDHGIDPLGRLTQIHSAYFNQEIDVIDPCGNIKEIHTNNSPRSFSYDSLKHLINEEGHEYVCDSLGRRIEKDQEREDLDLLNHLFSKYKYDRNGNPILKRDDNTEYIYDSLDRLTEVVKPKASRIIYTYDPLHRRLAKAFYIWQNDVWIQEEILLFLYDADNEIGSITSEGVLKELRVLGAGHGAEIGAAVAVELEGILYAPIHDLFGNLSYLIDVLTGTIASSIEYTAFGESSSSQRSPWGFSSKRTDPETGFVYFGRRYYVPELGRFLTPDPSGFTDGLNLYAYLNHSPLTAHDLYGLESTAPDPFMLPYLSYNFSKLESNFPIIQGLTLVCNLVGAVFANIAFHFIPDLLGGEYLRAFGHFLLNEAAPERLPSHVGSVGQIDYEKARFTVINGMLTYAEECKDYADLVSNFFGGAIVHYMYNSSGGAVVDLSHSVFSKFGHTDGDARTLAAHLRVLIDQLGGVNGGGTIYHIAFSEGGLITERALELLTEEERQMIVVNTFGSASLFSSSLARDVTHFVSVRDLVPMTDTLNYIKAVYCTLTSRPTNVHFVGTWKGVPLIDHGFTNKCYFDEMKDFGYNITKYYRGVH
ncbi:MAG: RHS repeat-associated core domain-containing protein [Chlamydiota bacterium]